MIGRQVKTLTFLWCDTINRYIGLGSKGVITGINGDKHVLVKFDTYSFEMSVDPKDLVYVNGK